MSKVLYVYHFVRDDGSFVSFSLVVLLLLGGGGGGL